MKKALSWTTNISQWTHLKKTCQENEDCPGGWCYHSGMAHDSCKCNDPIIPKNDCVNGRFCKGNVECGPRGECPTSHWGAMSGRKYYIQRGSFNNHLDKILLIFDHPPPYVDKIFTLKVDKIRTILDHILTPSCPHGYWIAPIEYTISTRTN